MAELRSILAVAAIALGCALTLAATNRLTEGPIERNEQAAQRALIAGLLGTDFDDAAPLPDLTVQPAVWRYCGRAMLARLDVPGYGGPIRLALTLEPGPLLGKVALLGHQETPGITDFLRDGRWLAGLAALSPDELVALDAVTGATITSRAISSGLAKALAAPAQLGPLRPLACTP